MPLNEWNVVLVISAILGLIGTVSIPLSKNTKAMTELSGQIEKLAYRVEESEKDLENFKAKASDRHGKIFTELDEHEKQLGDHEFRIQNLEKKEHEK